MNDIDLLRLKALELALQADPTAVLKVQINHAETIFDYLTSFHSDSYKKNSNPLTEGLIEGRVVHYVLQNGTHRPAIVVKVWWVGGVGEIHRLPENGMSNMQVFMDHDEDDAGYDTRPYPLTRMKTSVVFDEAGAPGTWHWIERV